MIKKARYCVIVQLKKIEILVNNVNIVEFLSHLIIFLRSIAF